MKKSISYLLYTSTFVALMACGGSKSEAKAEEDEVAISIPCSGPEFFTTKEYFRANSSGESLDQITAKQKALSNAKGQLAADINSTIKSVTDNYRKSTEVNNTEEILERFEGNIREVVNKEISGVRQICEEVMKVKSTGKYKYYVALELAGEDLKEAINQSLSQDQQLKVDYNYDKFKETFDKEMENYKKK